MAEHEILRHLSSIFSSRLRKMVICIFYYFVFVCGSFHYISTIQESLFDDCDVVEDCPVVAQEYITVKSDMDILSHETRVLWLAAYFFSKPA